MAYSNALKKVVGKAPKTLGNQLGRWAISLDLSVIKVSKATGATRQTIYNWYAGGVVTYAYRKNVRALLDILRTSQNEEQVWRKTCQHFDLRG